MYAISHAASALLIKRRYPDVAIWPLLVSVQAIELIWVLLSLAGVEHTAVRDGKVHLDFLPYSHSVLSTCLVAIIGFVALRAGPAHRRLATAIAIGILSHVVLDLIQHDRDIALWPAYSSPLLGLGLGQWPWMNLAVELAFGIVCWWIFRGGLPLLLGLVAFNVANIPTMLQPPPIIALVQLNRAVLPLVILAQIAVTWTFVAWASRPRLKSDMNQRVETR